MRFIILVALYEAVAAAQAVGTGIGNSTTTSGVYSNSSSSLQSTTSSTSSSLLTSLSSSSSTTGSSSSTTHSFSSSSSTTVAQNTTSTRVLGTAARSVSSSTSLQIISANTTSVLGTATSSSILSTTLSVPSNVTATGGGGTTPITSSTSTASNATTLLTTSTSSSNLDPFNITGLLGTSTSSTASSSTASSSTPIPSPTTTGSDVVSSTMTTLPPDVSTQILEDATTISENQWYTTTGSDSSETIVPLIVPCLGCAPIIVWNTPKVSGVTFDWPKFPKLPEFHIPCIKVFGITVAGDCESPPKTAGPPEDTSGGDDPQSTTASSSTQSSSTSSESSCTQSQTASDCRVLCKTTTASLNATATQTCSTTCFNTHIGCTVTGTTSNTTASSNTTTSSTSEATPDCTVPPPQGETATTTYEGLSACPASCPTNAPAKRTAGPFMHREADIETRAVAGRVQVRQIVRRDLPSTIYSLGACQLTATPAGTPVVRPEYPGGTIFSNSDVANNLPGPSADVARWLTTKTENCKPIATVIDIAAYNAAGAEKPSLDHAYEIDWLKQYFTYITGSGGIDCPTFDKYFFQKDSCGNENRLAAVFNALASSQNIADFVAMSDKMNQAYKNTIANVAIMVNKATGILKKKTNPRMPFDVAANGVQPKLDVLDIIQVGCALMNYGPMQDAMRRTYLRIYSELQAVDLVTQAQFGAGSWSFADKFAEYNDVLYNQKNQGINDRTRKYAKDLLNSVSNDLNTLKQIMAAKGDAITQTQKHSFQSYFDQYTVFASFGNPSDASNFDWAVNFDTSTSGSKKIKRQDSCSLGSGDGGSSASASASASGSQTVSGPGSITTTSTGNNGTLTTIGSTNSTTTSNSVTTSTVAGNTTSSQLSSTIAPPITSCALANQPATTIGGVSYSASQYCSCNDGWTAGLKTSTGDDGYETIECALGTMTTMAMSTQVPSITSCAISTQAATNINGVLYMETAVCACNDGWTAGVNTVDGGDGTSILECAIGTSTTMPVATITPSSTSTTMTPVTPSTTTEVPTPEASCHTQYKLVLDTFDIYGTDWDQAKLDGDGSYMSGDGLHKQLEGCAEVSKWKFDTAPDNDDWEFHASGQITIWQKNCIEHAMVSGGAPDGVCSGSG